MNSSEIASIGGIEAVLEDATVAAVGVVPAVCIEETATAVEVVVVAIEVEPTEQHSCCTVSDFLLQDMSENYEDNPGCWGK